ncbi:MAG: hypothetical protein KKH83_04095 [Candidatus Margulisbacteria bacterium]|nr:hypothetical protein [Candidatus Margulisiibacteriota bacterium]
MGIKISNNPYWKSIGADGKIYKAEIEDFTSRNTGLPPQTSDAAKVYLQLLLGNDQFVPIEKVDLDLLEKVIPLTGKLRLSYLNPLFVSKMGRDDHGAIINAKGSR